MGTIPEHRQPSFEAVVIQLPDDSRSCVEYSARRDELKNICRQHGLEEVLWMPFSDYYAQCLKSNAELADLMRASAEPDPNNAVFVFRKQISA